MPATLLQRHQTGSITGLDCNDLALGFQLAVSNGVESEALLFRNVPSREFKEH